MIESTKKENIGNFYKNRNIKAYYHKKGEDSKTSNIKAYYAKKGFL
jgi:hypothetical protein